MQQYFCSIFTRRRPRFTWGHSVLLGLLLSWVPAVQAGWVDIPTSFGVPASVSAKSIKELKYRSVIRQQFDFSCGSAAVATLLTHHYQSPVGEQEVFLAMYEKGNKATIHREGFSLADMKQYLDSRGYQADGIYADLDALARVGIPAIVLIEVNGYKHFVVIKGVRDGEVMVGDPALGLKFYRKADFEKIWTNGIVFVARNRADIARSHFNTEWASIARAPLGSAINRESLANITLLRPPSGDF